MALISRSIWRIYPVATRIHISRPSRGLFSRNSPVRRGLPGGSSSLPRPQWCLPPGESHHVSASGKFIGFNPWSKWLNNVWNRVDESRLERIGPERAVAEWIMRLGGAGGTCWLCPVIFLGGWCASSHERLLKY